SELLRKEMERCVLACGVILGDHRRRDAGEHPPSGRFLRWAGGIRWSQNSCRPQIGCERVAWFSRCAKRECEGLMDAGTSHAQQLDVGGGTVTPLRAPGRP